MSTDQERAEELLHYISNEPRHGDAIAAIVKEFENVRQAAVAAFARAHVPFQHDTDGPTAMDAIVAIAFDEEIERLRVKVETMKGSLGLPTNAYLYDLFSFLLAVAHQPGPGVVEVGGSSPKHQYGRCTATLEGEQCQLVPHFGSPHQSASGQRWETTGRAGLPRKI